MDEPLIVGVDIGGTHTDGAFVNRTGKILATCKVLTTEPVDMGVQRIIELLLQKSQREVSAIEAVAIGSTHALNALLQCRGLAKVGLLRLAGHLPTSLSPCSGHWPQDMKAALLSSAETVAGGFECNGRAITPFSRQAVAAAVERLLAQGAEEIAVVGTFAPLYPEQELEAASIIEEVTRGQIVATLSHQIGTVGFTMREGAALLNSALKPAMGEAVRSLLSLGKSLQVKAPFFLTQNDGSLIEASQAERFPLFTLCSGPVNSCVGAAKLAGLTDAVVVDVGGTSADIGIVLNGYPRRSAHHVRIGGIAVNFRAPDLFSLPIGGGTLVDEVSGRLRAESCGSAIMERARAFGGDLLTLTDLALVMGRLQIRGANPSAVSYSPEAAHRLLSEIEQRLFHGCQRMRGERKELPILLVGGGAPLLHGGALSMAQIPEHHQVANGYGAALAEVSSTIDRSIEWVDQHQTVEQLSYEAKQSAIRLGADPQRCRLVELQILPYHYMSPPVARFVVTASGPRRPSSTMASLSATEI